MVGLAASRVVSRLEYRQVSRLQHRQGSHRVVFHLASRLDSPVGNLVRSLLAVCLLGNHQPSLVVSHRVVFHLASRLDSPVTSLLVDHLASHHHNHRAAYLQAILLVSPVGSLAHSRRVFHL